MCISNSGIIIKYILLFWAAASECIKGTYNKCAENHTNYYITQLVSKPISLKSTTIFTTSNKLHFHSLQMLLKSRQLSDPTSKMVKYKYIF